MYTPEEREYVRKLRQEIAKLERELSQTDNAKKGAELRLEGKNEESNVSVHRLIERTIPNCSCVMENTDNNNWTKKDIIGIVDDTEVGISHKFPENNNTQVHLTTLKKLSEQLNMPDNIREAFQKFMGTESIEEFREWATGVKTNFDEVKHRRLHAHNIEGFDAVIDFLNANSSKLASLLLRGEDESVKYLVWTSKKTRDAYVFDLERMIEHLQNEYRWIVTQKKRGSSGGTALRLINNKTGYAIFHLQMKGSGAPYRKKVVYTDYTVGEHTVPHKPYNHHLQFHLHVDPRNDHGPYSIEITLDTDS